MLLLKCIRQIKQMAYLLYAKRTLAKYGNNLRVNGPCKFTKTTVVGDNVNFNGMHIQGKGLVSIGNNFHSGIECMIISANHNYEGESLPYDNTVICKKITIRITFGLAIE